ncbi:MAG: hypothetical protein ACKPE1_09775 [Dolichospermum sp.]
MPKNAINDKQVKRINRSVATFMRLTSKIWKKFQKLKNLMYFNSLCGDVKNFSAKELSKQAPRGQLILN